MESLNDELLELVQKEVERQVSADRKHSNKEKHLPLKEQQKIQQKRYENRRQMWETFGCNTYGVPKGTFSALFDSLSKEKCDVQVITQLSKPSPNGQKVLNIQNLATPASIASSSKRAACVSQNVLSTEIDASWCDEAIMANIRSDHRAQECERDLPEAERERRRKKREENRRVHWEWMGFRKHGVPRGTFLRRYEELLRDFRLTQKLREPPYSSGNRVTKTPTNTKKARGTKSVRMPPTEANGCGNLRPLMTDSTVDTSRPSHHQAVHSPPLLPSPQLPVPPSIFSPQVCSAGSAIEHPSVSQLRLQKMTHVLRVIYGYNVLCDGVTTANTFEIIHELYRLQMLNASNGMNVQDVIRVLKALGNASSLTGDATQDASVLLDLLKHPQTNLGAIPLARAVEAPSEPVKTDARAEAVEDDEDDWTRILEERDEFFSVDLGESVCEANELNSLTLKDCDVSDKRIVKCILEECTLTHCELIDCRMTNCQVISCTFA